MTYTVVAGYLLVLVAIGWISSRRGAASAEDYFLASRGFGTLVLFMALFGTNVTAFALLGLPGLAYHKGVGVLGFFGAAAAFWSPLCFILIGYPIWNIGERHGYLTPSQMLRDRWDSPAVGTLILVLMVLYTLPYLVVGVMGGGIALEKLTDGAVSYPLGAAFITGITLTYTSLGGMRGTAWTNVFQGLVFLAFLVAACIGIAQSLGGADALHARVVAEAPRLLEPTFPAGVWATGFLIGPVSVIAFPHMFLRLMAARDSGALRRSIVIYPWALLVLFIPVTLIGVWGAVEMPGLVGKESDGILPALVARELPPWLSAVGLAAILAAVMSSLDGQLLTMSTLGSVDVLERRTRWTPRRVGRALVVALAILAFLAALARPEGIFNISRYAFSGFTLVIPVLVAAFFWKRSTAAGVLSASLVSHPLLAVYHAGDLVPALATDWWTPYQVLPVALCLVVEMLVLVIVSLVTAPPRAESVARFARPFGDPAAS